MNGSFLLDTNIVLGLLENEPAIQQRLVPNPEILVPVVVLGELYYGARKSSRVEANLNRINTFLAGVTVVENDAATAYEYAIIRNDQRLKGRPIPENDLWIAAVARQHNLILVSRDAHFAFVDGIKLESW